MYYLMNIAFYNKQIVYYKKRRTHGGGRTRNLTIRSRARYPIAPRGLYMLSAFRIDLNSQFF